MKQFTCEVCGKTFRAYANERRGKHITCNMACFNKIRGKIFTGIPKPNNGAGWNKGLKMPEISGENHPNWKGGRYKHSRGYILIKRDHERSYKGYVLEHIVVMEKHLGRKLKEGEVIHHINHNKQDNRIENLELFASNGLHTLTHHIDRDSNGRFIAKLG